MNPSTGLLVVLAAGCGLGGRYMPKDIQGDIPLAVHNASGGNLCRFSLAPPGKDYAEYNLLRSTAASSDSQMKRDEKETFKVKPGIYELDIRSCQQGFQVEREINITGPTYVAIGEARPTGVPDGYAVFPATSGDDSCVVDGQVDDKGLSSDGRPCCSGQHHFDAGFKSQVCDPE